MKDKTPQEQMAATRQVELLTAALNGASENGYWMNVAGRMPPRIYPQGAALSPFNSLILALHADSKGFATTLYTTFQESKKRGETVLKDEHSVPMNWYRWNSYVNKHDDKDVISREKYQELSPEQQTLYKAVRNREIYSLFNIEQTTFPLADERKYENLTRQYGGIVNRGTIVAENRELLSQFHQFRENIANYLVPIRKATTGKSFYDSTKDAIYIPDQKHFSDFHEYAQELVRQAISATGHRERLAREGMVMHGGHAPSETAVRYERLISEICSGLKMMEFGIPGQLSPENRNLVEFWTNELKENPCLIDAIESDVNNAMTVMRKAEQGERIEYAGTRNSRQTEELREHERPQVNATEALVLQDIIRQGGMVIDARNFPGGYTEKLAFMDKFDLTYYEGQVSLALEQAKFHLTDSELINVAYTQAGNEAARIFRICSEMKPREWERKDSLVISSELKTVPDKKKHEFVVVSDPVTGIMDVILPSGVKAGGDVVLPNGDKRNFWLTPDEVMTATERKEAGASVIYHNTPGFHKGKIEAALKVQGATYVRFYGKEGTSEYSPDDGYFAGKEVYAGKLNGKEINVTSRFDVAEAVKLATEVKFERVQMLKNDDGRWALFLKPENAPSFSIYPEKEDVNRFFSTIKQSDHIAAGAVRNELAQKYYALGMANPELKVDLFGQMPEGIDPLRIKRVNVFRTKDERILCAPVIDGIPKVQPREISNQQWQRMWVAEDVAQYKTALAANLFADLLQQQRENETVEQQRQEDTASIHPDASRNFPNLEQHDKLKAKYPDSVLLFRTRDNYEIYKEDVHQVSKVLGTEKETRMNKEGNQSVDVLSFPYHLLDEYLPKLVRAGMRIAICDQLESTEKIQKSKPIDKTTTVSLEPNTKPIGMRM